MITFVVLKEWLFCLIGVGICRANRSFRSKLKDETLGINIIIAIGLTFTVVKASASGYAVDWWTIDGGGSRTSSGEYELEGTIGQPDAVAVSSGDWTLQGGFRQRGADCSFWSTDSGGDFLDTGNWDSGVVPSSGDRACFKGPKIQKTILFDGLVDPLDEDSYKLDAVEVQSGSWRFDLSNLLKPNGKPKSLRLESELKLGPDSTLELKGRTVVAAEVLTTTIVTPHLDVTKASIGFQDAILEVDGDLHFDSKTELTLILTSAADPDSPMIFVNGGTFRAGGKIMFSPTPSYLAQLKAGDRFRLVEFKAETKNVERIYDLYRFKDYDPLIPGHPDLFWGLTFREDFFGKQFLELLVLKVPAVSSGPTPPLKPNGARGLVFITHGTKDEIDTSTASSRGMGQLAEAASVFESIYGHGDWQVATLDWREYATTVDLPSVLQGQFFYNAATSAQIGIGIAESLVHWMDTNKFSYSKMHLLSHSSGSWLVNRMMQLLAAKTQIHLTFFDAFTNPSSSSPCFALFCDRFDSVLGSGAHNGFTEHYVDRNVPWSPAGTNERLELAVNFDVTGASIPSPPQHSPFCGPASPLHYLECALSALPAAHAWPYKWYLETISNAVNGQLLYDDPNCGGFVLSPEYLESSAPSTDSRSRIILAKSVLKDYDDVMITANLCSMRPPSIFQRFPQLFTQNATTDSTGAYTINPDGSLVMTTGANTRQSVPTLPSISATDSLASIACQISLPQPVTALKFTCQFLEGTNSVLSLFVKGTSRN